MTRNRDIGAPEICQAFLHYENRIGEDISPLEVPPALDSPSRTNTLPGDLCNVINWHTPDQVHHPSRLNDSLAYAFTLSLSREVLERANKMASILT